MDKIIFMTYATRMVMLVFIIILSTVLLRGDKVIKYENAYQSKQEFVKKHEKILNIIAKGVIVAGIILFVYGIFPAVRDIPNVTNKNYKLTHCIVLSQSVSGDGEKMRGFYALDLDTNEKMYLKVKSKKIYKDDIFTIQYLPYLKVGIIVK